MSDIYKHLHLVGGFEVASYWSLMSLLTDLVRHVAPDLDVNQEPSYKPEFLDKYAWPGTSLGGGRVRYFYICRLTRWRLCLLFGWNSSRH